jgi:hypothetical protein
MKGEKNKKNIQGKDEAFVCKTMNDKVSDEGNSLCVNLPVLSVIYKVLDRGVVTFRMSLKLHGVKIKHPLRKKNPIFV